MKPCPNSVIDKKTGERIYCEQGPEGHWGTCIGARSRTEYLMLCRQNKSKPTIKKETKTP